MGRARLLLDSTPGSTRSHTQRRSARAGRRSTWHHRRESVIHPVRPVGIDLGRQRVERVVRILRDAEVRVPVVAEQDRLVWQERHRVAHVHTATHRRGMAYPALRGAAEQHRPLTLLHGERIHAWRADQLHRVVVLGGEGVHLGSTFVRRDDGGDPVERGFRIRGVQAIRAKGGQEVGRVR